MTVRQLRSLGSKTITGTAVNDAPVLDPTKTPTLADIPEGFSFPFGAVGTLVSSLVDFATPSGGLDNVTDVDSGSLLGVAVTAVDSNLQCYFSLDGGGNWQTFVFAGPAYLVAADSDNRIYCRPLLSHFNGTLDAALTFHAWDRYQAGNNDGFTVNIGPPFGSPTGGTTPFSAATDTIKLTITPVNDPPTATNLMRPNRTQKIRRWI